MPVESREDAPVIRRANYEDAPELLHMITLLAKHHGDQPRATLSTLERDLFGSAPWATVFVAEAHKRLIGYAILLRLYNGQHAERVMDLHHLFVSRKVRRSGVGRLLVNASLEEASFNDCKILVVGTHPDNSQAQMFYESLGFTRSQVSGPRFRMETEQWRESFKAFNP